ncbi:hypothetical protein CG006_01625 [Mesoplasma florum]|uniref:hypothetical protein n=1 Tax=Mesoplasma florum TaxID=2151 RepID=UPI000D043A80|nr:hypothetical protein [Mesoplasma florum]AVN63678.1 hypothetical protein CG006_01625 [Mesoplasma florum]
MEKINEKEVAKKNYLNNKPIKNKIIIILILLILILSGFLTWAYGFNGFLYMKYKNQTIEYYNNIVLKKDNDEWINSNLTESEQKIVIEFKTDLNKWYETNPNNKYTGFYTLENIYTPNKIIFSITEKYWKPVETENETDFLPSIFFVYDKKDKTRKLEDLIYQNNDLERLEEYKNGK